MAFTLSRQAFDVVPIQIVREKRKKMPKFERKRRHMPLNSPSGRPYTKLDWLALPRKETQIRKPPPCELYEPSV